MIYRKNFSNVDELLDDIFGMVKGAGKAVDRAIPKTVEMRTNIKDLEDSYVLSVETPGFKKEEISMDVKDGILLISAEHSETVDEEKDNYIRKERYNGSCSRAFNVEDVDIEKIVATYDNGVLTVTLPKIEVKENKVTINIQ